MLTYEINGRTMVYRAPSSEEAALDALERAYEELAGRKPSKASATYSLGYEFRARLRRRGCPGDVLTRLNMGTASRADMTLAAQLLRPADPEMADQVRRALAPEDTADHPVAPLVRHPTVEEVFLARTMREKIDALEAQVAELERALALGQRLVDEHEETITRQAERLEALADSDAVVLQCDLIRGQHPDSSVWVTYTTDTALEDVSEDRAPARWHVTIERGGVRASRSGTTLRAAAGRATVSMQTAVTISKQQAAFAEAREVEG